MLHEVNQPNLFIDPLQVHASDVVGFSDRAIQDVHEKLKGEEDAPQNIVAAVGLIASGKVLPANEHVLASWQPYHGSRLPRPNGLLHIEMHQDRYAQRVKPLGYVVLLETCDQQSLDPDSIESVLEEVTDQLQKGRYGSDLREETRQVFHYL